MNIRFMDGRIERFNDVNAVAIDAALTNISVGYKPAGFIADQLVPRIPVAKEQGKYYVWGREVFLSETKTGNTVIGALRQPRTEYSKLTLTLSKSDYQVFEYGYEMELDDRERKNADVSVDPEVAYTELLANNLLLEREVRIETMLATSGNYTTTTTLSSTSQWSDFTAGVSDPIGVVDTGKRTAQKASGVTPNVLWMGPEVFDKVRKHPQLLDIYKYTRGGQLNKEQLAEAFTVERVVVGDATYNTEQEGQTFTGGYIWPKYAGLLYIPPNPGLMTQCTAYQFYTQDFTTFRYRKPEINCDVFRVSELTDEVLACAASGYLIIDAVA